MGDLPTLHWCAGETCGLIELAGMEAWQDQGLKRLDPKRNLDNNKRDVKKRLPWVSGREEV